MPAGFVKGNRAVARLPLFRKEADFEAFERVMVEEREAIQANVARRRPYGDNGW